MESYSIVYNRLQLETAIVTFRKKNGEFRVMLCTRNLITAGLGGQHLGGMLNAYDRRCSIRNGNVAVVDLVIDECRSFGIDSVLDIKWIGELNTAEQLNDAFNSFSKIKSTVEAGLEELKKKTVGFTEASGNSIMDNL